jgi:murein L,D-transpeptidase YafK
VYRITGKRPHQKWSRFLALDYPTAQDLQKFRQRKQRGEVPQNASPGGGVGIHGTWPRDEFMIDRYKNWTNGCIALKNEDVQEVYSYLQVGTQVTIRK